MQDATHALCVIGPVGDGKRAKATSVTTVTFDWLHRAVASTVIKLKVKRSMQLVSAYVESRWDVHDSYESCQPIRRVAIFLKRPRLDGETGKCRRSEAYKFLLLSLFPPSLGYFEEMVNLHQLTRTITVLSRSSFVGNI